ncbi:YfhO family protein [bacterium]|nr:YfhO family protein [candidate division CSSED10-310 bacterium]
MQDIHHASSVWPGLMLLVAACVVLFPHACLEGYAVFPGDLQTLYHPWRTEFAGHTGPSTNWILFDEVLEFFPWREHLSRNLLSGHIPLWDPTAFCGYPFQGLFQTALLYPPDRILDSLPFHRYTLVRTLFHLLAAGLGMGLYLKRHRLNGPAVTYGICAFGLCGFILVWLGHPHAKTAVWLPWLFIGADAAIQLRPRAVPLLTIPLSLSLASGHIETALHTISAAIVYAFVLACRRSGRKTIIRQAAIIITALTVSILLTSAMSIPFAEYLSRSVAYSTRSSGVVTQGWLDPILSFTLLMPSLTGSSADGTYWYPGFNSAEIGGAFIGVISIVLAGSTLLAFLRPQHVPDPGRRRWVLAHCIIGIVTFLTVFGIPPVYTWVSLLPGYRMSYNFRLVLPMAFSIATLSALGVHRLTSEFTHTTRREPLISAIAVSLLCLAGVITFISRFAPLPPSTAWRLAVGAIGSAITGGIILPAIPFNRFRLAGYAFTALVITELIVFSKGFNPESPPAILNQLPDSASFLSAESRNELFRTLPIGKTYPPHSGLRFGMHDIRGNDALTPLITEDVLALIDPGIRHPLILPALRLLWFNTWQSPLIDALNVRYIVIPPADSQEPPPDLIPVRTIGGVHIFENPGWMERAFFVSSWEYCADDQTTLHRMGTPGVDWKRTALLPASTRRYPIADAAASGTVTAMEYSDHRIQIDTMTTTTLLLVLSDTWYPGWQATVDSIETDCIRVNHMMRGVFVPPGSHRIEFIFRPVSWRLGLFLTLLGCMLIPLLAFRKTEPVRESAASSHTGELP